MTTKQGSLDLLNDPVAQMLLQSALPAHLAYVWSHGTPRVVPIAFYWNGREVVLGTTFDAPKLKVLKDGARVAVTIDSTEMPYKALMIRSAVRVDTVEGLSEEYKAGCVRAMGQEGGEAWIAQVAPLFPTMTRIFVEPDWTAVIDFETRLPNPMERAIERLQVPA